MKRKLMATLLALAMALAMLPATAFADISSAAVSTAAGNLVLRLNKAQFDPGEKIIASVDGITKNYEDDIYLCVFLCNPSDPIDKYIDYWWIRGTGSAYRDDISAPTTEGKYEIRLFTNGDAPSQSTLVSKIEIKVGNTGTDMQMSLNKTDFAAGETMVVTLTGVTQADAEKEPLVALCNPGQAHGQYADPNYYWWMTDGGLGTRQRNITAPNKNGAFELRLYANGNNVAAASFVMKIDITISGASASSGWAQSEIEKANQSGLIPDSLRGQDLSKPITRAEFAAVSVKAYENLTGKTTTPASPNPFTDTKDAEVLKAYNVGITAGTGATTFDPNKILNREQAAAMLTRVLKAAYIPGWTLATDGNFTLNFTQPAKFADDASISDWAKPSVYFMAANGIIAGVGNNTFAPKNTTTAQEAAGYANATREQAIVIAARMVGNLKDKTLDYSKGQQAAAPAPNPTTSPSAPTPAPSSAQNGGAAAGPEIKVSYTAAELAKIQADAEALIQDAPTGGTVITWDALQKILSQYQKQQGSGNTSYYKAMNGQFEKQNDKWAVSTMMPSLTIGEYWNKDTTDKSEMLYVKYFQPEKVGAVDCYINKEDSTYYYTYEWYKTATDGVMSKTPKTSSPGSPGVGSAQYDPSSIPNLQVMRYPDAKVAGFDCVVYSFQIQNMNIYFWFSKDKGYVILNESFMPGTSMVNATYTYDSKVVSENDAFFDPNQQGVTKWNEQ